MIKAIIFDVGGVLLRTPNRESRRIWEERLGLSEWESEVIVFGSDMGQKAQMGAISDQELWKWVGRHLALSPEQLVAFQHDFWAGDILDRELVDFIQSLRPQYQTAIISNATDALRDTLQSVYPIADAFDMIVCSAEEKVMKPDREIYERTLNRLGRSADQAIFIDDSEPNIQAARALGMKGIHFKPSLDLPSVLTNAGILGEKNEQGHR